MSTITTAALVRDEVLDVWMTGGGMTTFTTARLSDDDQRPGLLYTSPEMIGGYFFVHPDSTAERSVWLSTISSGSFGHPAHESHGTLDDMVASFRKWLHYSNEKIMEWQRDLNEEGVM